MKKFYYILSGFIISIILLIALQSTAYASGATISASPTSVEKGKTVTINADIKDASAWGLDISASGGNLTKVDSRAGTTESGNNESTTTKLGTFSADTAGTYTITLSGYVVDGVTLTKSNVSGTVKITVTDPPPVVQEPESEPEPEEPKVEEKPNFTDVNKTMYARKTINLRESWSTSSKATLVAGGTELTVTGTSTNTVNEFVWYRVKYNGQTKYVASYLLTDEKPVEEEPEEEPADEPTEEPADDPTTVDGTMDTKKGLTSLEIEGFTISPVFDPEVYEYRVIVKEDISELTINAIPALEGATISIAGNDNLQEGENLITIVVYNAENEAATYQITINKNTVDMTETDKMLQMGTKEAKRNATIFITIFAITIVALIIVMILRRVNKGKDHSDKQPLEEDGKAEQVSKKELKSEEQLTENDLEKESKPEEQLTENNSEKDEKNEINAENGEKQEKQSTENELNVENIMDDAKRQEYIDTIISEKRKGKYF